MLRAEMPPRHAQRPQTRANTQSRNLMSTNPNNSYQKNTRIVRKIKPSTTENTSQAESVHSGKKSLDPECTCYIREMMEDWRTVNLIKQKGIETKINSINKTHLGEYGIETQTGKNTTLVSRHRKPTQLCITNNCGMADVKTRTKYAEESKQIWRIQMFQQQEVQHKEHIKTQYFLWKQIFHK